MGQPPDLSQQILIDALRAHYNVDATALTYLPIGADMDSAVYRAQADGDQAYFVKLRARAGFSAKSLLIPMYLQGRGISHVMAPLETRTGDPWVQLAGHVLAVFPFIAGRTASEAGFSQTEWAELGRTMARVHTLALPPELERLVPSEDYIPSRRELLDGLGPMLEDRRDPIGRDLAAFWHEHADRIELLIARADSLGQRLRAASLPLALCHADLHTWNVLVSDKGEFWIVDWDDSRRAPKECDLMFVIGGIGAGLVRSDETDGFLEGYGGRAFDPLALVYYRYAWAVQDLAAYAEQAVLKPDESETARQEALASFKAILEPGQIAEIALASDAA